MDTHKTCSGCQELLPLDSYSNSKRGLHRKRSKCKGCEVVARREYRLNNWEKEKERKRKWRQANPETVQEAKLRRQERNPEKWKARWAVQDRIKSGTMVKKPCAVCGSSKVHAHHKDYSKPLDVIWLCDIHHKEIHGQRHHL